MRHGKTLQELAAEIDRQSKSKRDFVAPATRLSMVNGLDNLLFRLEGNTDTTSFGIRPSMHDQLATRLEIPRAYYDRMRTKQPALLTENVNTWLSTSPNRYMVRTLDGQARALLSDRYRPLDNIDLAESVLPKLLELGVNIESCEITESRLYVKAVTPRITAEVSPGDVVQAGLMVSNSEIGMGAIKIEPLVYRLVCANGAVINEMAARKTHVGRRHTFLELENADQYFRDETRMADDHAFWMKVQDLVAATLNGTTFQNIVTRWQEAKAQKITADPVAVVERTAKRFGFGDMERASVLTHLIAGHELSAYGLMNAVTRTAQDVESYDRSTELERLGPQILELPRTEWRALAEV